jgi:cytochrome P450
MGPRALKHKPERWVSENATKRQKYCVAFGAGYASCPGQYIARIQLSKITATLVRDCDILEQNPKQDWKYSALFTVVCHVWSVLVKRSQSPQSVFSKMASKQDLFTVHVYSNDVCMNCIAMAGIRI